MFNTAFKHSTIKNTVLAFGALFSNLKVLRNKTDGTLGQTVAVPITYGPKEKILVRLRQDPNIEDQVLVTLPRMAFEITGYTFDSSRVTNRNQKIVCHKDDGTAVGTFTPVPYNLNISLYILTKGTEDGLDIIEQILPTFMPEYTIRIKGIEGMNIVQDIPLSLISVTHSDEYEGDFGIRRLVTHTLDFSAKIYLYNNVGNANIITRTDTDVLNITGTDVMAHHRSEGDPTTGDITVDFWT